MGVRGLHSYMESSKDLLKPYAFRESKLIIDGCNLYYCLYFSSELNQDHGGDYDDFEKIVTRFFRTLRMCDIKPSVVLDGGTDVSDKKFETLRTRHQERIQRADSLSRGRSGEILPTLVKHVFKQTLRKLGVPFIQCLAKADWEAAALANEWNCPVLSNDSDFYLFSLKRGFLPITHFQWRKVRQLRHNGKYFIPTKAYHVNNLCSAFNRMNKYNLSLFAVILGNDYTELDKSTFPNFSKFSTRAGGTAQVDGVLAWLSRFPGPKEAVDALLGPLEKNMQSGSIRKTIYQGMAEYRLNPSSIRQFFRSGEPPKVPPGLLQKLPEWSLKPLAEGKLSSSIIEVLTLQRVMLTVQVEDFRLSSSSEASRPIRQVMYGVLLCSRWQEVRKGSRSSGEKQQSDVEEYDRQETKLTSTMVPAVLPRCVVTPFQLDSLWEVPQHMRLQVVLEALCVSPIPESLCIPEGLQLAVYVTAFWLKHATPEPRAEMFWALLISLAFAHLSREGDAEEEMKPVNSRFKKLQSHEKKQLLELELAHAFCQWQSCLKDAFILNQLLNHPLPEPQLARLYCGCLVHGATQELKRGLEPELVLAGAPVAIGLYRSLQSAVERQLDAESVTRIRTRMWPRESEAPVDKLSQELCHLMEEHEDEAWCSARTRRKTKRKMTNSRTKKR